MDSNEYLMQLEARLAEQQAFERYDELRTRRQNMEMLYDAGVGYTPEYGCGGMRKAALGDWFKRNKSKDAATVFPRNIADRIPGGSEEVLVRAEEPIVKKQSYQYNPNAPYRFATSPYAKPKRWEQRNIAERGRVFDEFYQSQGFNPGDEGYEVAKEQYMAGFSDANLDDMLSRRARKYTPRHMMMIANQAYFNKPEDATIVDDNTKTADDNTKTADDNTTEGTDDTEITTNPIQSTTQETTPVTSTTQTSSTNKRKTNQSDSQKTDNYHNITQSEAQRMAEEAAKKQGSSMEITNQGYKRVPYEQYAKLPGDIYGLSGKTSTYYPGARYALQIDEKGKERKLYVPYLEMSRYYGVPYEQIERDVQSGKIYNPDDISGAKEWASQHPGEFFYVNPTLGSKGWYDYSKGRPISKGYTLKGYAYGGKPYQGQPSKKGQKNYTYQPL